MLELILLIFVFIALLIKIFRGEDESSDDVTDHLCIHGYDYGCQPDCPLYEHCWGKRE